MAGRRHTPRFSKVSRKSVALLTLKPRATNYKSELLTGLIIHRGKKSLGWKRTTVKSHSGQFPQGTVLFFMSFHFGPHFFLDTWYSRQWQDGNGSGHVDTGDVLKSRRIKASDFSHRSATSWLCDLKKIISLCWCFLRTQLLHEDIHGSQLFQSSFFGSNVYYIYYAINYFSGRTINNLLSIHLNSRKMHCKCQYSKTSRVNK